MWDRNKRTRTPSGIAVQTPSGQWVEFYDDVVNITTNKATTQNDANEGESENDDGEESWADNVGGEGGAVDDMHALTALFTS